MVVKKGNRWCVVHGHPQKAGSKTDKPKGSIIKCYTFDPSKEGSEANAKLKAQKMHRAILVSQQKQNIKSFLWLDAKIQAFSQSDIISRIPQNILDEIKTKDPHPYFQMYSVAHEGTFTPKLEGKNSYPITWTKAAIKSIKNVIQKGIKFFNGHNEKMDNPDKQVLGEMVYSFEEEFDGLLHHCAIGYFPPETREIAKSKDICSQESKWNIIKFGENAIADICDAFKGIALASSKENKPAFYGTKKLAEIQAFENIPPVGETKSGEDLKEKKQMTFAELKTEIKNLNVMPHQLFTLDEIKDDKEFGKAYEEIKAKDTEIQAKIKELEDFKTKNGELNRSIQLQSAKGVLSDLCKENKLTDNITKFVNEMYEANKDKLEDLSNEGLKSFVESQTKIYQLANNTTQENTQTLPTGDDVNEDKNPLLKDD